MATDKKQKKQKKEVSDFLEKIKTIGIIVPKGSPAPKKCQCGAPYKKIGALVGHLGDDIIHGDVYMHAPEPSSRRKAAKRSSVPDYEQSLAE